jgi:hypothetical protein
MEFGVLNGECTVDAIRQLRGGGLVKVFGFDSFQGLPGHDPSDAEGFSLNPSFIPGNYQGLSCSQVFQNILLSSRIEKDNLVLIPGFFSDSLPLFDKKELDCGFPLVVYLDCDLYSSSMDVLNFIEDIVQDGTWLLADDYWCYRGSPKFGQRKAIDEWQAKMKDRIQLSGYCNFRGFGRAFIVNKI